MEKDELSFWDHLEELRWLFFRTIIALLVFMVATFSFMRTFFDEVILAPTKPDFFLYELLCNIGQRFSNLLPNFCNQDFHIDIININLASQFFIHISTSLWMALILTSPYLLYEIWKFVRPALYKKEQKSVRIAFVFGTVMFFLGCLCGYYMVFPMVLRFLAEYQISESITNQLSLNSYMDNFLMLVFVMGVVFELPVISYLLSKIGVLNKSFFVKYRKHAIVVLLILSAFITPSGDPFTLMVVMIPLYLLYEFSALIVKKEKKDEDEEDEEEEVTSEELMKN